MKELDFSKPELLQTRDGYEWRLHATDLGGSHPVLVSVSKGGYWQAVCLMRDGRGFTTTECDFDLIPIPQRVTGWANFYPAQGLGLRVHETQEAAKAESNRACIGQIYIDAEVQQ